MRTTTERGYGTQHQKLRNQWAKRMRQSKTNCYRCGHPIDPNQPWDLGHTPDRTAYTGPEHAHCNRSEGATRGNRQRGRTTPTTSRDW